MGYNRHHEGGLGKSWGGLLLLAGLALLAWNEYHHVNMQLLFHEATQSLVILTDTTRIDPANEGKLLYFDGWAMVGEEPHDSLYGVGGHYLSVQRHVQYYQWEEQQESRNYTNGGHNRREYYYTYYKGWINDTIDSENFHDNGSYNHKNFTLVPVYNSTTYSNGAQIIGYELDHELIDSASTLPLGAGMLDPHSDAMRAALHSTTDYGKIPYQLLGDTIYYGEDPAHPAIGDVRVTFCLTPECHAWVMAQADGHRIRPFRSSKDYWVTFCRFSNHPLDPEDELIEEARAQKWLLWLLRAIGWIMVVRGIRHFFDWFKRLLDPIPVLGSIFGVGINAISGVVGTILSVLVIGGTYVILRPWLGFTILGVTLGSILIANILHRRAHRPVPPPLPPC